MRDADLNLGHGVTAVFTSWREHDPAGLIEYHLCSGGNCRNEDGTPGQCGGGVLFDLPGVKEAFPNRDLWEVRSLEPLTLWPSLQCGCHGCDHHGWINGGKWQPA